MSRPKQLDGQVVLVTRAADQADEMVHQLEAAGAHPLLYPTIAVRKVEGEELDRARDTVTHLAAGHYDGLLLTSRNAVRFLGELLAERQLSLASVVGLESFAIGDATAQQAAQLGVAAKVAERSVSEGLFACVRAHYTSLAGLRFLLPRARAGRKEVATALRAEGAEVEVVPLYDTLPADQGPPLANDPQVDWITFASPSAVRGFVNLAKVPAGARVACIGPTTAAEAHKLGLTVDLVPQQQSVAAMLEAMAQQR